ncbi:MAG TPA: NAD(P)/FAD-dependent oxidoreductase [Clostridiales bacterium]|nr:NAD(P)/FAD-dependent oxidoreductase [Clostridiales bacterium]
MRHFNVLIIGAGAVGNAIAREVSKNNTISVAVLEKEPDAAFGISGRNSGVLHAGFNNKPGSLMAKLCVQGSESFKEQAEALGIEFKKTGKLVIARYQEDLERLNKLKEQGEANGVRELRIIGRKEIERLLGYDAGVAALWSGMTGIFDPFEYTIALAEAAFAQGTEFFFGRWVTDIKIQNRLINMQSANHQPGQYADLNQFNNIENSCNSDNNCNSDNCFIVTAENRLMGSQETFQTDILINCAGLYADEINQMLGLNDYKIFPCRGEYHILDKNESKGSVLPVYPIPNERDGGLGVHLTPTIGGNLMIGPSAEYLSPGQEREDYSTTLEVMERLSIEGIELFPGLNSKAYIRSFSGVRPKLVSEEEGGYSDFVIEKCKQVSGFIRLIGIESPGLTASIPIGRMVAGMVEGMLQGEKMLIDKNSAKQPDAHKIFTLKHKRDRGDKKMLCRCEGITGEAVLSAFDRILEIGAIPTIKGIKNRTRVTMGNCQGSFCALNIVELLQKKRQVDPMRLLWNGFGSYMFEGSVRK